MCSYQNHVLIFMQIQHLVRSHVIVLKENTPIYYFPMHLKGIIRPFPKILELFSGNGRQSWQMAWSDVFCLRLMSRIYILWYSYMTSDSFSIHRARQGHVVFIALWPSPNLNISFVFVCFCLKPFRAIRTVAGLGDLGWRRGGDSGPGRNGCRPSETKPNPSGHGDSPVLSQVRASPTSGGR